MNHKILFVTPALSKAGAETQLIKLASFLSSEGKDVLVISLLPKVDYNIDIDELGFKVAYLNSWRTSFFSNINQLIKIVRGFKPEIAIAFMFIAIIFARLLKILFGFTLISSIRAAEIPSKWYVPFKLTSGLDDVVVYNSNSSKVEFERQNLVKRGGVVINNAISIPVINTKRVLVSDKPFVWICVAHFRVEKDYMTLFKALSLLKHKNFSINIIGHLFNQDWPFKIIKELNIEDKVNLMGYKSNATDYLQSADAFVVSSFTESMPNAILEAMSNQKPVIATAVGGVPDLINSSKCGFCFELGNERDLAKKMEEMMERSVEERDRLAISGRKYIETFFSKRRVMAKWMNIIDPDQNDETGQPQHHILIESA